MSYSHVTFNLISYIESTQCSCVMRNLFTDTFNVHGLAVITIDVLNFMSYTNVKCSKTFKVE